MIQADQPKMSNLILQTNERLAATGMPQQFLVNPKCSLNVVLLFVTFSLPCSSVKSADLAAILRMDFLISTCCISQLGFVLVRALIKRLRFFVQTMRQIELSYDVANLCLPTIVKLLRLFGLVDEFGKRFPRGFVLIMGLLVNPPSLHNEPACLLLKLASILFVRRRS